METTVDLPADGGEASSRRSHVVRWVCFGLLAAVVVLGLLGWFGQRTETVSARGDDGRELSVRYPRIARGGVAIAYEVSITSPGGFDGPIEVEVDGRWLAMFDENGLDPDPDGATADGRSVVWTFEPPDDGDVLVVSLDARLEPAVQWGRDGTTRVRFADGEVLEVSFHTWVLP